MKFLITLLSLSVPLLLSAVEPSETESIRYRVKAYDAGCRLLTTGILNLDIAPPNEHGIRRVTGYRLFEPVVDDASPFIAFPHELIGRIEDGVIHLNLDRNVSDANTHVRAEFIDEPEPGFEGTWQFIGWRTGPAGRIIAARAPAEPTKPCEKLPDPMTIEEVMNRLSNIQSEAQRWQRQLRNHESESASGRASGQRQS